jgi:Flp pilus assembly protein TadG
MRIQRPSRQWVDTPARVGAGKGFFNQTFPTLHGSITEFIQECQSVLKRKFAPEPPRGRFARALRRLLRDTGAVSTVEMAALLPLFMLLIAGIIENGLVLFMQAQLDNATRDAARLTMTGQAQQGGTSFATQLCNEVGIFMTCGNLQYRIQTAAKFASLSPTLAGSSTAYTNFSAYPTAVSGASAGAYTLVQVVYTRTYLIPIVTKYFGSSTQILSTQAFITEPY